VLADHRDRCDLARHNERQGATEDLARDDHDLALALSQPTLDAIRLSICLFDVAAGIHAIDLDRAGQLGLVGVVNLRTHRLAQLVRQDERGFVLNIKVAA
jgi:hypothetical protein